MFGLFESLEFARTVVLKALCQHHDYFSKVQSWLSTQNFKEPESQPSFKRGVFVPASVSKKTIEQVEVKTTKVRETTIVTENTKRARIEEPIEQKKRPRVDDSSSSDKHKQSRLQDSESVDKSRRSRDNDRSSNHHPSSRDDDGNVDTYRRSRDENRAAEHSRRSRDDNYNADISRRSRDDDRAAETSKRSHHHEASASSNQEKPRRPRIEEPKIDIEQSKRSRNYDQDNSTTVEQSRRARFEHHTGEKPKRARVEEHDAFPSTAAIKRPRITARSPSIHSTSPSRKDKKHKKSKSRRNGTLNHLYNAFYTLLKSSESPSSSHKPLSPSQLSPRRSRKRKSSRERPKKRISSNERSLRIRIESKPAEKSEEPDVVLESDNKSSSSLPVAVEVSVGSSFASRTSYLHDNFYSILLNCENNISKHLRHHLLSK